MDLAISATDLDVVNRLLLDPKNPLVRSIQELVDRYGGPEIINEQARLAGETNALLARAERARSPYLSDLLWLEAQRREGSFVPIDAHYERVLGEPYSADFLKAGRAVTLKISWLQVFPCLMTQARLAIDRQQLMPGRYVLGKGMKEQEESGGLLATTAAMRLMGVSFVDMLDTNGTDGSNVHLGGADTLAGHFGGIGQPNEHVIDWLDEYLHYYTNFGIQQVLNVNYGTVFAAYLLHRLGVDIEFKISVFLGNDNPYAVLMNLTLAALFRRDDGSSPLRGLNLANSISNESIAWCSQARATLGLTDTVRFEYHVLQDWMGTVRRPFDRRDELVQIAQFVPNISAKHEGGDVEVERHRDHPPQFSTSSCQRQEIHTGGHFGRIERSYMDKHDALNRTAETLLAHGIPVVAAQNLHDQYSQDVDASR